MRFHVINLGCKVNRVESDAFAARFLEQGWVSAGRQDADLIIVNTCTVTGEADKKTRKAIRRALRENTHAQVLVTGCAAVIDPQLFKDMDKRVMVEVNKGIIDAAITTQGLDFEQGGSSCHERFSAYDLSAGLRTGAGFLHRVGIKIQDGCNNACTFCIVHHARGAAWSRDRASIIEEACNYEAAGMRELVLTGINIGSYRSKEGDLRSLLDDLLHATSALRFRISSIEPRDVTDELIKLVASSEGRICRHFHLPLQSGSDRVLRQMARPYNADEYRSLVDRVYAHIPRMSLSTDLIVGFPGETEEDFESSLELVEHCRFSKVHIFPYSKREGTPAAARPDQIEPQIKEARIKRMDALAAALRERDRARRRGSTEFVLAEGDGFGMTESYHKVALTPDTRAGELVWVTL